ncbi:MAG: glycosyltransferase family 39 protein [bacterium]|nr:glycosyltransferase family 39 protein [bacterium]
MGKFNRGKNLIYRQAILPLFFIFIGGFVLRLWGINFGLPELFHADERWFIYDIFYAMTHKGHVLLYGYGNFIPYIFGSIYGVYYIVLKIAGVLKTPFDFLVFYIKDPSSIYLIARFIFVIIGSVSIFAIYLLGKKLYNKWIGLIAAFFLAFAFLPIHQSKFLKGDTLGTFLLLFAFYFFIVAIEKVAVRKYIIAGIFMGLAIASRFTLYVVPLIFIIIFFIPPKLTRDNISMPLKHCLIFIITTVVVFLITTPSLIFEFSNFTSDLMWQVHNQKDPWVKPGNQPVWLFYITEHLGKGMGLPLLITGIIGILSSVCNYAKKYINKKNIVLSEKMELGIVIFLVLFFAVVLSHSQNFERYVIPVVPFIILFSAKFIYQLVSKLKVSTYMKVVLMCSVLLWCAVPNILNAIKYDYLISNCEDTRNIAKAFVEKNIPSGTRIVNEGIEGYEQTSVLGPPIHKSKTQILKQLEKVQSEGRGGKFLQAILEGQSGTTYVLENVPFLERPNFETKANKSVDKYVTSGIEYLITSSWRGVRLPPEEFLNSLNKEYILIKEFTPYPVFEWDHSCFRIDYDALLKVSIFDKKVVGGPTIKIYKKR